MKKSILTFACLAFLAASPLAAADLEKNPAAGTDQPQILLIEKGKVKGQTKAPNKVSTTEKVSSTGHKHDGQGSEDLHPNPLNMDAAESVNPDKVQPGNPPVQ